MMRTVTLDILKDEAIDVLKGLEALNVVRIKSSNEDVGMSPDAFIAKYSGTMSQQSREEIDKQLNDLRAEWD